MKILTIIGARPQFIKASVVSKALHDSVGLTEILLHTGQHFDVNMSDVFFNQLRIPRPAYLLDIHGGTHGDMTGRMLIEIEQVLMTEMPDRVLVYGDTNSTLAGALAAAKLQIPVAHVEAGLRSFDLRMPEEINRILTDQLSDLLFCPTQTAVDNLMQEGYAKKSAKVMNVGDVMQDSARLFAEQAIVPIGFNIEDGYVLATLHRAGNTSDHERLNSIVAALNRVHREVAPVVLPLHPRTRAVLDDLRTIPEFHLIEPVGYLEMIWLLKRAGLVMTDSGGVQKEAYFFGKPCVTMRDQTEWIELIEIGANELVEANIEKIVDAARRNHGRAIHTQHRLYGDGDAASKIVKYLQG